MDSYPYLAPGLYGGGDEEWRSAWIRECGAGMRMWVRVTLDRPECQWQKYNMGKLKHNEDQVAVMHQVNKLIQKKKQR